MNWIRLAENRIDEAIANGEFDDLPGKGKPLDLADYFAQPAAERAGSALLKSANVLPPEVELLKAIALLETALLNAEVAENAEVRRGEGDDDKRKDIVRLREELQEKRVAFALTMERRRRREECLG
jgi:hypothetical protein